MDRVRVVGAYAAQPAAADQRRKFVEDVLALPGCDGLEIPFGSVEYNKDKAWLWDALPPGRSHVLTLVAAAMEALAHNQRWGPASGSAPGRVAFLDLLARARDCVAEATDAGHRIVAVQVQSAPRATAPDGSSPHALRETLATAAAWDWSSAILTVEHCDAHRSGEPFAKGFLTLGDEIAVVRELAASGVPTELGITINWGRSAIEGRDPATPNAHLRAACEAGVLTGLMFSGTCDADGPFGPVWPDSHAPLRDADPSLGEPTSLLTEERVLSALDAAGPRLRYDGLKIGVRPRELPREKSLTYVRRLLASMRAT